MIVGGGASGVLVALHLLRRGDPPPIAIVEPSGQVGRGVAYRPGPDHHVLNVRCGAMSAYADDPQHFLRWLARRGGPVSPDVFVARHLFGSYLQEELDRAAAAAPAGTVRFHRTRATGLSRRDGGWRVRLDHGGALWAEDVVLATGNPPPADPAGLSGLGSRYVGDCWSRRWLDGLDPGAPVVIVGSGLTAVDVIVDLDARGHRGPIEVVSRHGRFPQAHGTAGPCPAGPAITPGDPSAGSARGLLRSLRRASLAADRQGQDWRAVVDGLRPVTGELWRALPPREKERFRCHLAARWNQVRHRIAPEAAALLDDGLASGRVRLHRGRVAGAVVRDGLAVVEVRRGQRSATVAGTVVVNCTGPGPVTSSNELVRHLVASGTACPGPLGLGLAVDRAGRVLRPGPGPAAVPEAPADGLWAMGLLRQGAEWESTAVPELRRQAAAIAAAMAPTSAASLGSTGSN